MIRSKRLSVDLSGTDGELQLILLLHSGGWFQRLVAADISCGGWCLSEKSSKRHSLRGPY